MVVRVLANSGVDRAEQRIATKDELLARAEPEDVLHTGIQPVHVNQAASGGSNDIVGRPGQDLVDQTSRRPSRLPVDSDQRPSPIEPEAPLHIDREVFQAFPLGLGNSVAGAESGLGCSSRGAEGRTKDLSEVVEFSRVIGNWRGCQRAFLERTPEYVDIGVGSGQHDGCSRRALLSTSDSDASRRGWVGAHASNLAGSFELHYVTGLDDESRLVSRVDIHCRLGVVQVLVQLQPPGVEGLAEPVEHRIVGGLLFHHRCQRREWSLRDLGAVRVQHQDRLAPVLRTLVGNEVFVVAQTLNGHFILLLPGVPRRPSVPPGIHLVVPRQVGLHRR